MVWYQCRFCRRFLENMQLLRSHTKTQHPQEYARALEESRRKKGQDETGNSGSEKSLKGHDGKEKDQRSSPNEEMGIPSPSLSVSSSSSRPERNIELKSPQDPRAEEKIECQNNKPSRQSTRLSLKAKFKNGQPKPSVTSPQELEASSTRVTTTKKGLFTKNPEKRFHCVNCGVKFRWGMQLKRHLQKFHPKENQKPSWSRGGSNPNEYFHAPASSIVVQESVRQNHNSQSVTVVKTENIIFNDDKTESTKESTGDQSVPESLEDLEESTNKNSANVRNAKKKKEYSCLVCGKMFKIHQQLAAHVRIHTREKPFSCTLCDARFTWKNELKRHCKKFHKSTPVSSYPVTAQPQRRHLRSVAESSSPQLGLYKKEEKDGKNGKILVSNQLEIKQVPKLCSGKRELSSLNQFSRQIFQGQELFVCNTCITILPDEETAKEHFHLSHGQNKQIKNLDMDTKSAQLEKNGTKNTGNFVLGKTRNKAKKVVFKCHVCSKLFLSSSDRTLHRLKAHRMLAKKKYQSQNKISSSIGENHNDDDDVKIKDYDSSSSNLKEDNEQVASPSVHLMGRKSIRRQKPQVSHQSQSWKTQTTNAFKSCPNITCKKIQGRTFVYICKFCGKKFSRPSHAVFHTRIHTGERPYKCKVCPRTFRVRGNLRDHELIHEDEKPFRCSHCSKTFRRIASLRHHQKRHEEDDDGH